MWWDEVKVRELVRGGSGPRANLRCAHGAGGIPLRDGLGDSFDNFAVFTALPFLHGKAPQRVPHWNPQLRSFQGFGISSPAT